MSDEESISINNSYKEHIINDENLDENKIIFREKIGKGSDLLHILPAKLKKQNNAIRAPVDFYFESDIQNENASLNDYICHFRGRKLNGKKFIVPENINLQYYELMDEKKDDYIINQTKNIKEYYIWKYDEKINLKEEPMSNLEKTLKKFEFLG